MDDFASIINNWADNTKTNIDSVLQDVVIELGSSVVRLSPVLTGRFKGNWQLAIDVPTTNSLIRYDPSGGETIQEIKDNAKGFTAGEIAYIQNHVLYGPDLEGGTSRKAPEGMVGITVVRFANIVRAAVLKHKEKS